MKTLFFPFYPKNPYQPNLVKELEVLGYKVDGLHAISPLAMFKSLCSGYRIYHLHWTDPYILSKNPLISVIKSSVFLIFLTLIKLKGSQLIWTVHNFGKHEKSQQHFERFVHRMIAKLANGIITHNRFAKKFVIEKYGVLDAVNKIYVIPHGNYIGNYPKHLTRCEARKALKLSKENIAILFLGQIRPYKGVCELMRAFSQLEFDNGILIVTGRPFNQAIESQLSKLAKEFNNIVFRPGFVADEKIQEFMKAADVVVFPFKDIMTSGSVLLAMSFGKAIIVPELESLEEIIAYGGAITFNPEDGKSLTSALTTAFKKDLKSLGRLNLAAAKKLSWDNIAQQTANVYAEA